MNFRTSESEPVSSSYLRGKARRATLICALLLIWFPTTFASSLDEYRDRVAKGIAALEVLRDSDPLPAGSKREQLVAANIHLIRTLLPPAGIVEWQGTSFRIDNNWLEEQLRKIENTTITEDQHNVLIDQTLERLRGLQARFDEIDKSQSDKVPNKGEMRERLADVLARSEYARTVKEESALKKMLRQLFEWIGKLFPKGRALSPGTANVATRLAQFFVIGLALAAIGYATWMFAPRFLKRNKTKKSGPAEARIVLGERLEPDQSAADLLAEAEALARAGDLRGAIRRGYIALLIELADRKLISLAQHKTNHDYLRSVREMRDLHQNMERLTNNFEQHWYGLVPPNENDWLAFRAGYRAAVSTN